MQSLKIPSIIQKMQVHETGSLRGLHLKDLRDKSDQNGLFILQ